MDHAIPNVGFDRSRLTNAVAKYEPKILAFTSKRAAKEFLGHNVDYGPHQPKVGSTRLVVLTSPSGAARRYWDLAPWRELARLRDQLR